jgi:hypothetical protein
MDPEDILTISSDRVGSFIREQVEARNLSPLMQRLNRDLLGKDPTARAMAARALKHLGFVDRP